MKVKQSFLIYSLVAPNFQKYHGEFSKEPYKILDEGPICGRNIGELM